ncbi:MAG: exodeoxyribonuclease VII large subunit [Clostridia bacterium]|nr:exodeoxyribonuclease VII large subunit [Clostridia bacterium]
MDESRVLTVTKLNEYVKMLIDGNPVLSKVWVKGEISNLTFHGSGHLYFSLKDEGGRIASVMFRSAAQKLKFRPENGMKVLLYGRVSVYPRDGQIQLYATSLEPDGVGALYIAYEQLKKRLEAEGLFRPDNKKPLPKIPSTVGVITSPTGAAVQDILNVTGRRFPFAKILLYPALVQGEGAEADLVAGIEYFSHTRGADVVIIGRGGGSIEDLWAFNSEALARAIVRSPIPVISAVGHETDFTICDFAADRRAPTPSAAAELAVPDSEELKRKFGNVITRMEGLLAARVASGRDRLKILSDRRVMTAPTAYLDDKRMLLLTLSRDLERSAQGSVDYKKNQFTRLSAVLEAVSPLKVIAKGYSAVFAEDGRLIRSVKDVKAGDKVSFRTADGTVDAAVTSVRENVN